MQPTPDRTTPAGATAHGMGTEPVVPDWPPLTEAEVAEVLGHRVRLHWRSPRPFSAAALVAADGGEVFVKRHHVSVRDAAGLAEEHGFLRHLRTHGVPVPEVLPTADGGTVAERGPWTYEVHTPGHGEDLYRDALSWTPFASTDHAAAAGRALAWLHLAAEGYHAPARGPQPLVASFTVFAGPDPVAALERHLDRRPTLRAALDGRPWREDTARALLPQHRALAPYLANLPPLWTHNDWHASNLLWTDGEVSTVLDFGLCDRTTAIHDLATALERNTVEWLDPAHPVHLDHAAALLHGYLSRRPLSTPERAALPALLPLVHAEFALSELDYFHTVTRSPHNADLAYAYYVEHAAWFGTGPGRRYLEHIRRMLTAP
jgi:Ser/Thr protein kinase RdoA (MazF antagonist)